MHLDIPTSATKSDAVFGRLANPETLNTGNGFRAVVEPAIVGAAKLLPIAGLPADSGCKRRRFGLPTRPVSPVEYGGKL